MTAPLRNARATGWFLAWGAAVALVFGVGALALAADGPRPVVTLDLGQMPRTAAAMTAVAAPAPQVADTAPPLPEDPALPEAAPEGPATVPAPEGSEASAVALAEPDVPVVAEMQVPEKTVKPRPKPKRADTPSVTKDEEKPVREKARPKAVAEVSGETAVAPRTAESKAKTPGGMSPAAYAKAVMKKVRATRKASGAGKGTAVVGFSIGADGGLAGVRLLQSSGNAALDRVAQDHIRRAAPFPAPPPGAGRSYSFEFVGK